MAIGKTTEQRVLDTFTDHFYVGDGSDRPINLTDHIYDDLGGDSLDMIEVVVALEEEFNLEIPDDAVDDINSVGDAVKYVEGRLAA